LGYPPRPELIRSHRLGSFENTSTRKARFTFAQEGDVRAMLFRSTCSGRFGHRGEDCTFETLRKEFRVRDARVAAIGGWFTTLTERWKVGRKEAFGVDEVLKGWARRGMPDKELLGAWDRNDRGAVSTPYREGVLAQRRKE